jgi:2-polyprenyl-6-hydroxyphenyl methylase/3-demethylubiquinone-9 3-methyltransferase
MTYPYADYPYNSSACSCAHAYLLPTVEKIVSTLKPSRIFELGCGNGSAADRMSRFAPVIGIDTSESGVRIANETFPHLQIKTGSAYDDLCAIYGRFPLVISLEVVEHLYDPRLFAVNLFNLVEPGGTAIVSTPYHGYCKNLALAAFGRLDDHFTSLWDGGHIKFWSFRTLRLLLRESGFAEIDFLRVGRIPPLAKSMIAVARRAS